MDGSVTGCFTPLPPPLFFRIIVLQTIHRQLIEPQWVMSNCFIRNGLRSIFATARQLRVKMGMGGSVPWQRAQPQSDNLQLITGNWLSKNFHARTLSATARDTITPPPFFHEYRAEQASASAPVTFARDVESSPNLHYSRRGLIVLAWQTSARVRRELYEFAKALRGNPNRHLQRPTISGTPMSLSTSGVRRSVGRLTRSATTPAGGGRYMSVDYRT